MKALYNNIVLTVIAASLLIIVLQIAGVFPAKFGIERDKKGSALVRVTGGDIDAYVGNEVEVNITSATTDVPVTVEGD